MTDFWRGCGYKLLDKTPEGHLVVTDEFLRHLLAGPEMTPVPQSGEAELALHAFLLEQPRGDVDVSRVAAIPDEDARSNYEVWLRFRNRLLAKPTLEASYRTIFEGEGVDVPPVLVHQLTQILVRHQLGESATPIQARAAELLFRAQRIAVQPDGQVMAADDEIVERHAVAANFGTVGELLKQGGAPVRSAELDVLHGDNADVYWERDEAHDMVLSLNHGHPGLEALCRVLEGWVAHFFATTVRIKPITEFDQDNWAWHVGLDAQASGVLNDWYQGKPVSEARMARVLCLFQLEFDEPSVMRSNVAGKPVYLAMATDEQERLRIKPQNLLLNLPLAQLS
jgi:hypothetical protein